MCDLPALQTHGLYDETWEPPQSNSRCITYTRSDEFWLRPLGLGALTRTLKPLFDVRLDGTDVHNDLPLVGYTEHDPHKCRFRVLEFMVIDHSRPVFSSFDQLRQTYDRPDYRNVRIEITNAIIGNTRYVCWTCQPCDVLALVESKIISVHGHDDIRRFACEQHEKEYLRRLSLGLRPW